MRFDFSPFSLKAGKIITRLENELSAIRAGNVSPALLDSVRVKGYGTKMSVNQLASVSVLTPRCLRIEIWDKTQIPNVEAALTEAGLGATIRADESGIQMSFPELTRERRQQLIKLSKSKLEEARVSLRALRDETIKIIEKEEGMGDDEKFMCKNTLEKHVKSFSESISKLFELKHDELQR